MPTLSDSDFDLIVSFLEKLPERTDPSKRKQCWQTADELLSLFPPEHGLGTAKELDAALCARFLAKEDCPVRFAYYPDEDSCRRLRGHTKVVGSRPGRKELRVKLEQKPFPLEPDYVGETVRPVFLSHAIGDHHFAARVRLNLARHGIRSWLAEGDLHDENQTLFEAVEASLHRCYALIMLVSSISVSSAWVFTEAQSALGEGKGVFALIDASDAPICKFLRGWSLANKSPKWLDGNDGIQALSDVLERYMGAAPPKTRVLKFRKEVESTLYSLTMTGCVAFYPDVPLEWDDRTRWKGFESVVHQLGTENDHGSSVVA